MRQLFNITLIAVVLYVFYRLLSVVIMPQWNARRLKKYKEKLLADNPHIDRDRLEQKLRDDEERRPVIDKRRRNR